MQSFRELRVWERGIEFAVQVRGATESVSSGYAHLVDQVRRAADAVPSIIAEGAGHPTRRAFAHYLGIAIGSANEVESHLFLMQRLTALPDAVAVPLIAEITTVRRMLISLRNRVRAGGRDPGRGPADLPPEED